MTNIATEKPPILIVDDEINTCLGLARALTFDWEPVIANDAREALKELEKRAFPVVLTDVKMPKVDGITLLKQIRELYPHTAVLVMSAYNETSTVVEAIKHGAYDFITKPFRLEELESALKNALDRQQQLVQEHAASANDSDFIEAEITTPHLPALRPKTGLSSAKLGLVGHSRALAQVMDLVRQVAPARSSVLLSGESGTGKEVVAKALHLLSPRAKKAFVGVNCAALNANLLEAELFGHEKGAFTGASAQRKGRFEIADGGTLFLDEIGEIDQSTQVKLLRALESRSFERVGGNETITVNVRLVAATNKNLRELVASGKFREDLYYRLDVIHLELPPLRQRREDIPDLLKHFLEQFKQENAREIEGFSSDCLQMLIDYDWPGNVRELRNIVERLVVLARTERLSSSDLPSHVRSPQILLCAPQEKMLLDNSSSSATSPTASNPGLDVGANEKMLVLQALERCGGNRSRAAETLGISRRTLHRRLKEYGIN